MENLVVITAHCPTEEQEKILDRCVDSVLSSDYHVALISHTHVPIHIQKKCNYYFYDYLNDVSDDVSLLGLLFFECDDFKILSRYFNKNFYGLAIYRMFSIASQIAINFGYKNVHHIEYDCELMDKDLILENVNSLETHDSVIYTDNGNEDGFLFGSFKSFKVESLPDRFKNYNPEFMVDEMRKIKPRHLEFFTKKIFMDSGKVLFGLPPSEERFKRGLNFYNRNMHYTLFYNSNDGTLNIFYKSEKKIEEEVFVIVNKTNIVKINVKPNHWHRKRLGIFDEINYVRIDNSERVIYEKTFDSENREIMKENSYIILK